MKFSKKHNLPLFAVVFSTFVLVLLSLNILHAATVPVYQRLYSISEGLSAPSDIALDANERIYVTEPSQNSLNVYSPGGYFIKNIKMPGSPSSVAVDSSGRIFVGNEKPGNVEIYDADFNLLSKLGLGDGEFAKPCAITIDSTDMIYVADCEDDKIKIYNPDGSLNFSFGSTGNSSGQFNLPNSVAVDENAGEIMVTDTRYASGMMGSYQAPRVQVFDMGGVYKRVFGVRGVEEGKLFRPTGITIDSQSRVYITDAYQNVVQVFDNIFTSLGVIFDLNNPVQTPQGIAIGNSNRLFTVSHNTARIEVYGIDNYANMLVTPESLSFQGSEGGLNPSLQDISIINSGTAAFNWTASTNDTWITLSQTSGSLNTSEASTVSAGVDLTGLLAGTYNGNIEIASDSGALEVINVTLTVTLPPELSVTPSSLTFTSTNGSIPPYQGLSINNMGEGTLDWTGSADMSWILLDKNSGTAPDTVNVAVDPSSMAEGTYTGSIRINGAGATGSPATIAVTLNVLSITGTINVTTNLPGATFIINGPASYSGSGTSWSVTDAPVGTYIIVFGDVGGYVTPSSQTMTLLENGSITFNGQYNFETGTINVNTNLAAATFTISGPATYSGSGTTWSVTDAPVGTYQITFGVVSGYYTPSPQVWILQKDGTISFNGQYDIRYKNIIAGTGHGDSNNGFVKVLTHLGDSTGVSFYAHSYMYGVNIASGDIDGDGIDEIITGPGPGQVNPAEINIFDRDGNQLVNLSVTAFSYGYGTKVASGDFDGDGYYEVIAGPGAGNKNPARVKVFAYDPVVQGLVDSGIDLLAHDSLYGIHLTTGDVDGDGTPELITSPGPGKNNVGNVRIWDIDTSQGIGQWSASLINEFTVQSEYKYSVTVASGDVNGDGFDEIITGDGPHKSARDVVRIFTMDGVLINVWQAGTAFGGYGANVASGDLENDGVAEIIVAPGPGFDNMSYIKVLDTDGMEKTGFHPFFIPYGANVAVGDLGLEGIQ
ncbi:MAG: FG-GAP-like repeat-containing protein [Nitrospirota bacterium]